MKWLKVSAVLGLSISMWSGPTASAFTGSGLPSALNTRDFHPLGHNVYTPEKKNAQLETDKIVLKLEKSLTSADYYKSGTKLIRSVPELGYAVVQVKDKKGFGKAIAYFQKSTKVLSAAPSVSYLPQATPDPKVSKQYFLNTLQVDEAHKLAGTKKVKVAVIDQGIDRKHPEIDSKVIEAINVADPMNAPMPDFHGTHVGGIIAGEKGNGVGGYGVSQNAELISIDVFDRGWGASDYIVAEGILEAVNQGAKVINMSLGFSRPSPILEEAVNAALAKNVTVVASAGNRGNNTPNYPASYEGVISVGSTNDKNALSSFSSYGTAVDVVAPGEDIYAPLYDYEWKSTFYNLSGTSMSAPMVSGLASQLLAKHPSLKPSEVEYIIEHTAKDLGSAGYDTSYAHGLIQPVAALKFDPKKIPAAVKNPANDAEILKSAESLTFTGMSTEKKNYFAKASQMHWYKFPVTEGDYIQTQLIGAANYDYKYDARVFGENQSYSVSINRHQDDHSEAGLLKAPFTGVMVIGVKDANGNYDDSTGKKSSYTLKIDKTKTPPKDENTAENMKKVDALPFDYSSETLFGGEKGDQDYYELSVKEPQLVKVATKGVPGVNTGIRVYMKSEEMPPEGEGKGVITEKGDEPEGEEGGSSLEEPMFMSNSNGSGDGEVLTFPAMPDVTYYVEITNQEFFSGNFFEEMFFERKEESKPEQSLLPYELSITSKVISGDEDGLSAHNGDEEEEDREEDSETRFVEHVIEQSTPYEVGGSASGYIQTPDDADHFKFTSGEAGVYEFNFGDAGLPMAMILKAKEVQDEDGKLYKYFEPVSYNFDFTYSGIELKKKMVAGLEKNTQYVLRIMQNEMDSNVSFDPYSFTSKLSYANVADSYEPNNDLKLPVKALPSTWSVKGNFASAGDYDPYYFKAKEDGIIEASLKKDEVTSTLLKKYPAELLADYVGLISVVEDVNQNQKIDEEEFGTLKFFSKNYYTGTTRGSFKAKKGKGYFVVAEGWMQNSSNLSLLPYTLKLQSVNKKDEDAGSVVQRNKPSKPLSLKKVNSTRSEFSGYLNAGKTGGDEDWIQYKTVRPMKAKITLDVPLDLDGVITVYQNGRAIASSDHYVDGDDEVLYVNFKYGTYYIEVKDRFGKASTTPYKLTVSKQ
ncbi:S8 family serine peptidase [Fictibacillus iocasae]|uniref:S8 family serine peptidase n=1 Tax=Fictibacillus iocasae TaxID=2715437 RepID=A0ABW2NPR4_9BACL